MVLPILFGVATAASGIASAVGGYQQANAQKDATNRARLRARMDQIAMQQYTYGKELGIYEQAKADLAENLLESERALERGRTALDKQLAESYGAAAFAAQDETIANIQAQGQIAALPRGVRERAGVMLRGAAGRKRAFASDDLLRARFGAIDKFRTMQDEANAYRKKLYGRMPLAPTMAPTPSMPVMQPGPSALSLIGGIGSSILGGIQAGYAADNFGKSGSGSGN